MQSPPASDALQVKSIFGGNMPDQRLKELYIDELKDLYSAENQLVRALPKMAKAASSEELREGFEKHLEQTRGHVPTSGEDLPGFG
jgi:Domain of unknown function (DUF892)